LVVDTAKDPRATLLVGHGAGNGIDTADLLALARTLPQRGVTVVRFEQPWKVAGRKVATPPATLDVGLHAAVTAWGATPPFIVGGRSAGARSAARCAAALGAAGCLALAFPLHPPGRPDRSRLPELAGAGVPTLVVQGERDPMGRPEEFPAGLDDVELLVVPTADHGLKVPARAAISAADVQSLITDGVWSWIRRVALGNQ